jgi:hypothetical protein
VSEVFPESPLSPPPATATPGQAAREAFGELGADWYPGTPWNGLHEDLRAQWDAAAAAVMLMAQATVDYAELQELRQAATAPELAAAMAETRAVRDGYQALCGEFGPSAQSGWSARISLTVLNRHQVRAGLPELPRTRRDDAEDVTMRYRRERDEARAELADVRERAEEMELQRDEARWQRDKLRERLGGDHG